MTGAVNNLFLLRESNLGLNQQQASTLPTELPGLPASVGLIRAFSDFKAFLYILIGGFS